MARDDELFPNDEFFNGEDSDSFFDDLAGEEPLFPDDDDDFALPFEDVEESPGGVSRTFKIVFGILLVAVVGIVVMVILLALGRSGAITDNEKTSTAAVATNTAVQIAYGQTVTAQFLMVQATENAIQTQEAQATQTEIAFQTQQAVEATHAAETATAQAQATQTAQVFATQTAEFQATQTAEGLLLRMVSGQVMGEGDQPFANVTLRLYRDDGDGEFNPQAEQGAVPGPGGETGGVIGSTPTPAPGAGNEVPEVATISYGQTVDGELETGVADLWNFSGTAGDVLNIEAVAVDNLQTDMFMELVGPTGSILASDDDSGGNFNAALSGFELPSTGDYVIRVSSVTGPGAYTLTLSTAPAGGAPETGGSDDGSLDVEPTAEAGGVSYVPRAAGEDLGGIVLVAQGNGNPTPTPEGGDEFLSSQLTGADGSFDFGALEPGTYWIELEYASLPPNLQSLVPSGEALFIRVDVPTTGEPIIFPIGAVPTPAPTSTPQITTSETPSLATVTPTSEPGEIASATPGALPTTGFFDDLNDSTGGLSGSSGLTILAVAAVGLVAVVFIARKLRTSA